MLIAFFAIVKLPFQASQCAACILMLHATYSQMLSPEAN